MMHALRTLFNTAIIGSSAILWLFVSGLVAGPFLWLFSGTKGRNVRKFVYWQSRGILFCMRLCSSGWKTQQTARPKEPCIVAANHASSLDLYCVAALGFDNVVYITKGWVFKLPFFRYVMNGAGYLDAEKTPPEKMLAKCQEALQNGCDIVLFPQGSRKNPNARFKSGAFYLAEKTGAPIVPVAIGGTGEMLPAESITLHPAKIVLKSLPAVYPKDFQGELAHLEMARETKNRIMQSLQEDLQ
ncbi:MAG: lysophospholipid acyltransferase family protein [Candidatus Avelusimicrobium sp.]|uniref:lysophospholipid acyltransferase family protein n=1 Tax=Candidatus Avelusimicrobium sp. TaxID=3048833 RepID=UPI003F02DAD7